MFIRNRPTFHVKSAPGETGEAKKTKFPDIFPVFREKSEVGGNSSFAVTLRGPYFAPSAMMARTSAMMAGGVA
jgi:hypothetical protein